MPEVRQDPTRLKNAIKTAEAALKQKGVAPGMITDFRQRLERFQRELDYRHLDQGLCVFVGEDTFEWHTVPHAVDEAVVVDETFVTRDLVRAVNRQPLYDVLVLSEKTTRFYNGRGPRLSEEMNGHFPMTGDDFAYEPPEGFSRGVDPGDHQNERLKTFLRRVAQVVDTKRNGRRRPLFVAGVERLRSFYQDVSGSTQTAGQVEGNFDHAGLHELREALEPVVKGWLRDRRHKVLERFDEVKGTAHGLTGLEEIAEAAAMGRVEVLLVEDHYVVAGRYDRETGEVTQAEDIVDGDVVDDIVETVLEKSGEVHFYKEGRLAQASAPPMGAILRY